MAKRYARANCDYSFQRLRRKIPAALATVSLDHIRKDFLEVLGLPLSLHGENISECGYTTV